MSKTVTQSGLRVPPNPTVEDIFNIHMFEEPLVPIGVNPTPAENAALVTAILNYSKRMEDFSSLTEFLEIYPKSSWNAALLTDLGIDYYKDTCTESR
jgi:hypothetical protein